jgi:hypothetical protein
MSWTPFEPETAARELAAYFAANVDDERLTRIVQDVAALVERQPKSVRASFWLALANMLSSEQLARFFAITSADKE